MSFRDFITNRQYRRAVFDRFSRKPAPETTEKAALKRSQKLINHILSDKHAADANRELERIGRAAVPAILTALNDPQCRQVVKRAHPLSRQPVDMLLELLVPHEPDAVLAAAKPLVNSPEKELRKVAGLHIASLGRDDTVDLLAKLLNDPDGYVRSSVGIGVCRAVQGGRCGRAFRDSMRELFIAQADQSWGSNTKSSMEVIAELDPSAFGTAFSDERWLTQSNPNVHRILEQANKVGTALPVALVRKLLDHSLPLAVGEKCYPHQYIVAAALEALAISTREQIRPELEGALKSDQDCIQEGAARAMARLAGLTDAVEFVFDSRSINRLRKSHAAAAGRVFRHRFRRPGLQWRHHAVFWQSQRQLRRPDARSTSQIGTS